MGTSEGGEGGRREGRREGGREGGGREGGGREGWIKGGRKSEKEANKKLCLVLTQGRKGCLRESPEGSKWVLKVLGNLPSNGETKLPLQLIHLL